ncbi:diguanylate cyclase [Pseudobacteroides cellulosolvens]|uniref:diguanylate cyclase n=1 Tax=Pseudobacteroides cellulosolvens TaxID=35825 RepID=UPI0005605A5A|nr:diguanylate cyclase [Pseudobacteroides cellulosolvens]
MAKNRAPEKGKIGFLAILFISLALCLSIGTAAFIFMNSYFDQHKTDQIALHMPFVVLTSVSTFIIFVLLGIIFNRITIERTYVRELKNFKDFTDSIHNAQSEREVYERMYEFICRTVTVNNITLFYKNTIPVEGMDNNLENPWQRLGHEKVPLCNMSPSKCPVIRTGRECRIVSIQNGIKCAYQLNEYKQGSYVCLTIVSIDSPQSILQLYSQYENEFNDALIHKIKSYTEIAKTLIKSRRKISTLDKSSKYDNLTKVYNRGYFVEFLKKQVEIALYSKENLSIMILDIDFFKKINDTYGHFAGDHVLALFAKLVVKEVRVTDLVARYGGEEFVVVLPSTDVVTAYDVAERVRQAVEKAYMPPYGDIDIPSISCSIGVSTLPLYSNNKDDLIKTADLALYQAKRDGRNMTKVYDKTMAMIKKE